jgi:hypothetical protein
MITVGGRVAMQFDVDEELFEKNPDQALQEALKNGRAVISDGDNYLPEPWNEGIIKNDVDFSLGIHSVCIHEKKEE